MPVNLKTVGISPRMPSFGLYAGKQEQNKRVCIVKTMKARQVPTYALDDSRQLVTTFNNTLFTVDLRMSKMVTGSDREWLRNVFMS